MRQRIAAYFATLARLTLAAEATDGAGNQATLDDVFGAVMARARAAHASGNKVMFIGNGGSAAIASHMAIDYTKNGGIRALAFNDGAALTCLGNDLGYAQVFARQIEMHARSGDLLIAISSSGNSANILAAVEAARGRGCAVVTFSGFRPDNKLRAPVQHCSTVKEVLERYPTTPKIFIGLKRNTVRIFVLRITVFEPQSCGQHQVSGEMRVQLKKYSIGIKVIAACIVGSEVGIFPSQVFRAAQVVKTNNPVRRVAEQTCALVRD